MLSERKNIIKKSVHENRVFTGFAAFFNEKSTQNSLFLQEKVGLCLSKKTEIQESL